MLVCYKRLGAKSIPKACNYYQLPKLRCNIALNIKKYREKDQGQNIKSFLQEDMAVTQ